MGGLENTFKLCVTHKEFGHLYNLTIGKMAPFMMNTGKQTQLAKLADMTLIQPNVDQLNIDLTSYAHRELGMRNLTSFQTPHPPSAVFAVDHVVPK